MLDPNETYQEMFRAMTQGKFVEGRKLALSLKAYFENGGDYPYQYAKCPVDAYIASVLRRTYGIDAEEQENA